MAHQKFIAIILKTAKTKLDDFRRVELLSENARRLQI
jgi:hypothetical protein